ncbi:MAG: hypothetical protein A2046_03025 [Bacteroidetes bacterium GWA2_30_7]|nr:MAG: hypothetical protein A2046_03025 [Bacteroidetes bacterium GWA2_30_7]
MENSEEKLAEMFKERISVWKKSQIGQKSGYEYERSFALMMREIEEEVFKEMTSTELINKNKKKL